MNLFTILSLVFIGGGLGSVSRFGITRITTNFFDFKFPIGTLIANTLACLILGLTLIYFKDKVDSNKIIKYFLVIGFCGGFSTFSTFGLDTVQLLKDGFVFIGVINILVSLSLGFTILWVLIK